MRYYQRLLPRDYVSGHILYVRAVKEYFRDGCHWLDAGGGRRIFHDACDGEAEYVARAGRVVVADVDQSSLDSHESVSERVRCGLDRLPFPNESFDLVTCGMVVEHLENPEPCFVELGRVLRPGGRFLVHTVNRWGYPTLMASASRVLPFRRRLIALVTGRKEEDIFPTHYRCNTESTIRRLAGKAGLTVEKLDHWHSSVLFERLPPLGAIEALAIRCLSGEVFARFRGQLFAVMTC